MEESYKRETAYAVKVPDLLSGQLIRAEGMSPNHLFIHGRRISRVNIIGTIIDKTINERVASFSLDDGFGHIAVSFFDDLPYLEQSFATGDTVIVIGRVTDYNGIKINGEVMRKIDQEWVRIRKQELEREPQESLATSLSSSFAPVQDAQTTISSSEEVDLSSSSDDTTTFSSIYQRIWQIIKDKDTGEGVDMDILKEESKLEDEQIESTCQHLLKEGEVYEIRPGFYKVLE